MPKMVMMRMRKAFRALASMTDSRRNVERGAWGASERGASGAFGEDGGWRVSLASGNHSAAQNPGEPPSQQPHHRCRLICLRKQPHSAVSAKPPRYSCKPIAMTCEFGP